MDERAALALLERLDAPQRLIDHARVVERTSARIVAALRAAGASPDAATVAAGAILHDAGKTIHPEELSGPGTEHEAAGERLLLDHGAPPSVAHCAGRHGRWSEPGCSYEALVVALADKLWKGQRLFDLEQLVIEAAAARAGADPWGLFPTLSEAFDRIAAEGPARLLRTQTDRR